MKTLWITWEEQRRNWEIANAINAEFHQIIVNSSRIKRYFICLWRTFNIYRTTNAKTVICQNPSIVLALFTAITGRWFGLQIGIDTHNGGLALDSNWILKKIAIFLQRRANFIIITNEPLKKIVEKNGGKAIVLPDKIPTIKKSKELLDLKYKHNILFICSFAEDEPYEAVFETAKILEKKNIGIWVTGKYKGKVDISNYSTNVHFTGRIPWEEYNQMLYSVDGIIDLTTREYCLVCGAYESVAVEKPMILSNTEALKGYFCKGAIYTDNTSSNIALSIKKVLKHKKKLTSDVRNLKTELDEKWEVRKQQLMQLL